MFRFLTNKVLRYLLTKQTLFLQNPNIFRRQFTMTEIIPKRNDPNLNVTLGANKRTVSTLCGSWRPTEEDGGPLLVLKIRTPCLSPDPDRECDFPENVVDFWEATPEGQDGIEEKEKSGTGKCDEKINDILVVCEKRRADDNEGNENKELERETSSTEKCDKPHNDVVVVCEKRKSDDNEGNDNKKFKRVKLTAKGSKAKRPGFSDDRFNETSYYIENGLRKVYPYYFTFTTYTKGRWVGDKIFDVFSREFRAAPAAVYEKCITEGYLTVNGEKVDLDYRLQHNDLLAHVVHRHEVPVTSQPITFVHVDEDLVVINKPASIPVHPCGRYRHNTIVFILAKEYNFKDLRTIHRLDRLTSGLLMFGRSFQKAQLLEKQIRSREVEKEYLCRVVGEFPEEEIECNEPIEVVSYKIGVCKVSAKGKDSATVFKRIGYSPKTNCSVVLCRPKTGRMHQIRVHLQYLGYPIQKDPLYNHKLFGPMCGKGGDFGGKTDEQLVKDLIQAHNAENWLGEDGGEELLFAKPLIEDKENLKSETTPLESVENSEISNKQPSLSVTSSKLDIDPNGTQSNNLSKSTQTGQTVVSPPSGSTYDANCSECQVRYRDPKPADLVMYLHASKYKGPGWEFETEPPQWASIDWEDPGDV